MSDLISRQTAIDALDEIESEVADGYGYQYEKWRKYFCGLPSAQPERKRGKWIKQDCGGVEYTAVCSECGYGTFWSDALDFDFCPKCGSYNRGEQDE